MAQYPSFNDREFDLIKKITENTAEMADIEAGDVHTVAGTLGNVLVNGAVAPAAGDVVLSLPANVFSVTSIGIGTGATAAASSLHVVDTGTASPRGILHDQYNNGTNSAQINTRKARGSFATPATIVTGDVLGRHIFWGHDGTAFIESGNIRCTSSGTIGTNRVPSQLEFYTSTNANPSVLTLGLTLTSSQSATLVGNLTFGTSGSILNGTTGSIGLTATGTNQSITLTPSGTGNVTISNSGTLVVQNTNANNAAVQILSPAGTQSALKINNTTTEWQWYIGGGATGLRLYNGSDRIMVAATGNLLLAGLTTDGTGVVQLPAATATSGGIGFGTEVFLYRNASNSIAFGYSTNSALLAFTNDGNLNLNGVNGNLQLQVNGSTGLTIDTSRNLTLAKLITSYNGNATAGNGVVTVQGSGRQTAQTGADASVATYTVGAADASFVVSANVNVTTATAHNFTVTVTYTDEGNTSRTLTLSFSQLAGTIINNITNVTGAGPYEGLGAHIRCKASTSITIATTGTFTTVTYNVEGNIRKLS